jgi:hypothetical protein
MRLAARSSRIIAGALSIAAIAAPAASARINLEPTTAQSRATTPSQVVRPNPDQQTTQTSPVTPPILRTARASELAAINRANAQEQAALSYRPPATARYSSADTKAYARTIHPVAASAPTLKAPGGGFDYGDAAIGAGITAAIALLLTAGTLTVRRRSQPQHS